MLSPERACSFASVATRDFSAGEVIACVEKLKVLRENLEEIQGFCQEALEDAVLMGCAEEQFRDVLKRLVDSLENPYPKS